MSGNCTEYLLNVNESLCPPEKSGAVTTYTCELETGHGARRTRSIEVTYLRKGEGQVLVTEQQIFNAYMASVAHRVCKKMVKSNSH